MNKMQVGHFEPDGDIIYLPLGFKASLFLLCELGATNPVFYIWWGQMEDDEAANSKEGVKIPGGSGTFDKLADDGGFADYDTGSAGPTISEWAASTAYTAATATAHGSYVKPTTSGTDDQGLVCDREAVFECVTAGTSGSSEPTWPSAIGGLSALDGAAIWQKVSDAAITRQGYQGVRIAAALMTNGQEMYYAAWLCNEVDHADVADWPSGVDDQYPD